MRLAGSLPPLAEVFYVVESIGPPGRREHYVASLLYETRAQAHTELARLSAAQPAAYSIWKGTTYLEPPRWGYLLMRADGTVIPPGEDGSTRPFAAAASRNTEDR